MATKEEQSINIENNDNGTTKGTLYFTAYDSRDRIKRATISWLGCWGLAGITLFIPIAHFFLVPAFFIAGPIIGISKYKQIDAKEKVVGLCPQHKAETSIHLEATDKLPKWTYCPECNASLQLTESKPS